MAEHPVEMPAESVLSTAWAPSNLAVAKYWGRRNVALALPVNSSLSGTLDMGVMRAETTVVASRSFEADSMELNDEPCALSSRVRAVVAQLLERANDWVDEETGRVLIAKADWPSYRLRIVSHNNFPTAAGLASSAAGLACLTRVLADLYCVRESFPGELSAIARLGSGSATRSMYGGWVRWDMGKREDGTDSIAVQVAPETHWPEMRALILVVSSGPKDVGSTEGMQRTTDTSPFLAHRAAAVIEPRLREFEDAIGRRDFEKFGELTIKDSNNFHATCLDSYPPIFYMNDTSHHIIRVCHAVNRAAGRMVAAYTFDAGSNATVYCLEADMDALLRTMLAFFVPEEHAADPSPFVRDPLGLAAGSLAGFAAASLLDPAGPDVRRIAKPDNPVRSIYVTKIGEGAKQVARKHTFGADAAKRKAGAAEDEAAAKRAKA